MKTQIVFLFNLILIYKFVKSPLLIHVSKKNSKECMNNVVNSHCDWSESYDRAGLSNWRIILSFFKMMKHTTNF